MSDQRDLPMDPRLLMQGDRDQMIMLLGKLLANSEQRALDISRMDKKIDDLGGMSKDLDGDLRSYIEKDNAAHAALGAQIERVIVALGDEKSGVVKRLHILEEGRVRALEDKVDSFKNFTRGAFAVSTAVFTLISVLMTGISIWFKR